MSKLMHTSKVKVVRESAANKIKRAEFEGFPVSVRMGVHGGIAEFFHLKPDEPVVSALDYVVAALGCCMTGTIGGALEARGVSANPDNLQATVEGKIEDVDGKLILTGIKVHYRMKVPKEKRASVERGIQSHEDLCPVSLSIRRGITVEWDAEIEEVESSAAGQPAAAGARGND